MLSTSFPNSTFQAEIETSFELRHTLTLLMLCLFWECIETSTLYMYTITSQTCGCTLHTPPNTTAAQKETHPNKADNKDIHGLDHTVGSGLMTTKQARLIDYHDFT